MKYSNDNTTHIPASQRRHYRASVPLHVTIGDRAYKTRDWSLGGLRLQDYHREGHKKGEVLSARVALPFQGFNIDFPVDISIVDTTKNTLGGEFINLDDRSRGILKYFFNGLVSGEMKAFEEVIRRLDVPVSLASLQPDSPAPDDSPPSSRRWKQLRPALGYLTAGLILTAIFLAVVYTQLFQIQVNTAMVVSSTEILQSPVSGSVAEVYVEEKADVIQGQPLIRFLDPELEQDIELTRVAAQEKQSIQHAHTLTTSLKESVEAERKNYLEAKGLFSKGYIKQSELVAAKRKYNEVEQEYIKEVNALKTLIEKYNALVKQRDELVVRAPANGRFLKLLASESGSLKLGNPVAIFEKDEQKSIHAFLTQKEALSVVVSDRVSVYFPSLDRSESYIVTDIDYISRAMEVEGNQYVWNASSARNVTLVLRPEHSEGTHALETMLPGSSVIVVIPNKPFLSWLPLSGSGEKKGRLCLF